MSGLTFYHSGKNRVYVRKFDHDEARARYTSGWTVKELAQAFGVTRNAVYRVVVPGESDRQLAANKRWRTDVCEMCGKPCLSPRHSAKKTPRPLCRRCLGITLRERLRFDENGVLIAVRCSIIDCATGERWQTPANFTRGGNFHDVREGGIHDACRACQTRAKRDYRRRHPEYKG